MRVLQLGKFYPIRGGVEKVMWDLTAHLPEAGVACDMLCAILPGDKPDPQDASYARMEGGVLVFSLPSGGRVFCVKALAKKAATMLSPAMVGWLRKHKGSYDIIHVHHPDPMAAMALRLSGFKGKVVLHWHSDILSQKGLLRLYRPLQNWLIRRADVIVGTTPVYIKSSPWLQDCQKKCTFVPIGIDPLPEGEPVRIRNRYPCKVMVLSVGRLVPYKGYSCLVDAAAFLPDGWKVIIGGKGPLQAALQEQIRAKGLEGKVELAGYLPQEDIPSWFAACDVFVLSSVLKTEAFGIVQIEAMSLGKPVVTTLVPGSGMSWVNAHGESGLNVPPGDPKAMAQALVEVVGEKEKYGKAALERFRELFTTECMINKVKAIYEAQMV